MSTSNDSPESSGKDLVKEALIQLRGTLKEAAYVHYKIEGGRLEGARVYCQAIAHFLWKIGFPAETGAPILEIMQGFKDLQEGIQPTIFCSNPSISERPRTRERRHHRRFAAALLNALIKLGEPQTLASARVARKANTWSNFEKLDLSASTIVNWRKQITRLPKTNEDRKGYEILSATLLSSEAHCQIYNFAEPHKKIEAVLENGPPFISSEPKS